MTFSGDGTVNEVVNGLMREVADGPAGSGPRPAIARCPAAAPTCSRARSGCRPTPAEAVQRILAAVATGERRKIGLGLAGDRYFTFSAGLGVDAEVIADIDRQRAPRPAGLGGGRTCGWRCAGTTGPTGATRPSPCASPASRR